MNPIITIRRFIRDIYLFSVNQALVDALTILQHRGQDAAGIVTSHNNRLNLHKNTGTVAEVSTIYSLAISIAYSDRPNPTGLYSGNSCQSKGQYWHRTCTISHCR